VDFMKNPNDIGNKGYTFLKPHEKLSKNSPLINALGAMDEVSSVLGCANAFIEYQDINDTILLLQNDLYVLLAEIAGTTKISQKISKKKVEKLTELFNSFEKECGIPTEFVLPGGKKGGAMLHLARSIARRGEREIVMLSKEMEISQEILVYVNILSDLLFVLARLVNKRDGFKEKNPSYL